MTVFGWDASHYDAPPTTRDGIDFYTHKVTDGDHYYEDPEYQPSMAAAKSLGISVLGSYHVLHGGVSVSAQADWWVSRVRALTPWWSDRSAVAAWMWQVDAERFNYLTTPTIGEINALGDAVCARAGCPASSFVAYAPTWVYGNALTGLRYRVWASNYGSNPTGLYRSIYPGDMSSRWQAPVNPLFLQYGSRATIAGQTTCDANAYRGTLSSLIQLLNGGTMTLTQQDIDAVARAVVTYSLSSPSLGRTAPVGDWLKDAYAARGRLDAMEVSLADLVGRPVAASPADVAAAVAAHSVTSTVPPRTAPAADWWQDGYLARQQMDNLAADVASLRAAVDGLAAGGGVDVAPVLSAVAALAAQVAEVRAALSGAFGAGAGALPPVG